MLKKDLRVKFQKDGKVIKLVVLKESYGVSQQLRTEYAVAFRRAITMGVATRASMSELLKREDVWTEADEQKLITDTIKASLLEQLLHDSVEGGNDDGAKNAAIELVGLRGEIYELVQIKYLPLEHTAESIAEDVKLDAYITLCTVTDKGHKYFKDHKDFLARREDRDVMKIYNTVVEELSKDNIEIMRKLPENKWLMDHNIIDKDGSAISDEVEKLLFADNDIEVVTEEEEVKAE